MYIDFIIYLDYFIIYRDIIQLMAFGILLDIHDTWHECF